MLYPCVVSLERKEKEKKRKIALSQMATYWFVIDRLNIWKAQKSKVRQAAKDIVKSEV